MSKLSANIITLFFFLSGVVTNCRGGALVFMAGDSSQVSCSDTLSWPVKDFTQHDCRSQSYYTALGSGDTLNLTFIVYSGQDFRIGAFCDRSLGGISYRIIEPERENIQKVKKVNENEEIIYKLDEYGEQILGSDDKPVVLSKEILRDTIWDKSVVIHETVLYDSENSGGVAYYDLLNLGKTKRLTVKLRVNENNQGTRGCVAILIGRKYSSPFKIPENN